MTNSFQPIQLFKNIENLGNTGHLKITANQVTWDFYFTEGLIRYGCHSLQSLETIQYYLLCLKQETCAQVIPTLAQKIPQNRQLIPTLLQHLSEQNHLSSDRISLLTTNLIKDALESCLWLRKGEYHWSNQQQTQPSDQIVLQQDPLLAISNLLDNLEMRMKTWQTFSDVITSPYQRLVCTNPSLIQQKIPSGTLNPTSLEKLVKLMQGKTLRQISLFLKQDELNVARLLFPYLQNNILQLKAPQPPLDKLPPIPPLTPTSASNQQKTNSQPLNNYQPTQGKSQKTYKIVCIDDSSTILDMIKAYLEGEQYEVFTVDNPTQSLPCLFKYKPDLILLDFSMPGINGNKLCRIIKASSFFKDIPIIMISGNSKMLTPENIQEAGATDYLAKPFTKEALQSMVNQYLSKNTKINLPLSKTKTDRDSSLIPNQQTHIPLSNDSTRKPIKITRTVQDIDSITQLPNRQCFEQYLSVVLKDAQKTQFSYSLMFLRIDNFTDIQATLGQTQGNKILQNVAKQIQSSVRANDIMARWSHNEFVILLNHINDQKIIKKIGKRILETIQPPTLLLEHQLTLNCIIDEEKNTTQKSEIIAALEVK
ncbi:MAG: diguanylate cyclase [Crocosphaera sp.]|nr:diguanylate cyclase [Crocosphaera sp.]